MNSKKSKLNQKKRFSRVEASEKNSMKKVYNTQTTKNC